MPDKHVITAIGKKLGKRILVWNCCNFNLADNISNELRDKYMVDIDNGSKESMVLVPRGRWWSNEDNEGGDESNIMSKEEGEEEEDKVGNATVALILSMVAAPTKMRLRMIW